MRHKGGEVRGVERSGRGRVEGVGRGERGSERDEIE